MIVLIPTVFLLYMLVSNFYQFGSVQVLLLLRKNLAQMKNYDVRLFPNTIWHEFHFFTFVHVRQ